MRGRAIVFAIVVAASLCISCSGGNRNFNISHVDFRGEVKQVEPFLFVHERGKYLPLPKPFCSPLPASVSAGGWVLYDQSTLFNSGLHLASTQFDFSREQGHEQKAGAKLYGTLFENELQYTGAGGAHVTSSLVTLDSNLGAIEGMTLEATLKSDPTKKGRIEIDVDIACHKLVAFRGMDGNASRPHASNGPDVTAIVTKADLPKFKQVTFVVATGGGQQQYGVIAPGHPVSIESVGGDGYVGRLRAGGDGGSGGSVHVTVDDRFPELGKLVRAASAGGTGGGGSVAGRNGGGGRQEVVVGDVTGALRSARIPKSVTLTEGGSHTAQPPPSAAPPPPSASPSPRPRPRR